MNLRYGVLYLSALCLAAVLAASPARAQTRVGEAAVIQNEVVRVAGSATSQINVGDGVCATRSCAPASTARRGW